MKLHLPRRVQARMPARRAFSRTLLAASMLLLLAVIALWLRSYRVRDGFWYTTPVTRYSLHSYRGRVWFWMLTTPPRPTASVWPTPARMGMGFVWDSAPNGWYDQFRGRPKGVNLIRDFLNAPSNGGPVDRGALGFRYVRNDAWWPRAQLQAGYPTARSRAVYVPHWALAVLTALPASIRLLRVRRAAVRRRQGRCPVCGYDMRATPDRCPECGKSAASGEKPACDG